MNRPWLSSLLIVLSVSSVASAQLVNRGGANTFGGTTGFGNAGGFATGPGFANGSSNSTNFGSPFMQRNTTFGAAVAPSGMQGIPGVSNYGGSMQSNTTFGSVMPGVGTGANMGMYGMNGMVPGIAPPGFTRDIFGYESNSGGDSGYTSFGDAITASALGLGYGGPGFGYGYGGLGYGGLGYGGVGPLGYGAMGYSYPGMVPGSFLPGVGYVSPADFAAATGLNPAGNVGQSPALPPARNIKTTAGAKLVENDNPAPANTLPNASPNPRVNARRTFLNDNVPLATANAIRIQNRLHNVKNPDLSNVKVMIANRTAILSGTVNSQEDEKLALRMVALEPGVVEVKSELKLSSSANQNPTR